jgi:hypothetical protein
MCRWQLKHGGRLTLFQQRQQNDPAIGKFQRVVMSHRIVLVDLPGDCGLVEGNILIPWPYNSAPSFVGEDNSVPGRRQHPSTVIGQKKMCQAQDEMHRITDTCAPRN